MKFMYTQGIMCTRWYPVYHRFPSGAKQIMWWKFRITWGCQFEKAMKRAIKDKVIS